MSLGSFLFFTSSLLPTVTKVTPIQLEDYVKFQEYHFELRLNPEDRSEYISLLKREVADAKVAKEIQERSALLKKLTSGDWLGIYSWHRDQQDVDHIEISTEQTLNNGTIYGGGLYAQLRKQAKDGRPSSKYLLSKKLAYDKPVRGDGNIYSSLHQRHLDASYEWTAFRLVLLARRKVWDGTPANRAKIQKQFISVWDKTPKDKIGWVLGWHNQNKMDWIVWRVGDYSYLQRMTPYQLRLQIVDWGREIVTFMPEHKSDLDARVKELKDYASKMPDAEVKSEFERMEKANSRFKTFMMQREQQAQDLKANFASMRKALQSFHVANLNIAENTGNSGYRWTLSDKS